MHKETEAPAKAVPVKATPKAKTEKQVTRQKILTLRKAVTSIISGGDSNPIPTDTTTPKTFNHCIKCRSNDLSFIAEKLVDVLRPSKAKRKPKTISEKKQRDINTVELFLANCSSAFLLNRNDHWYSRTHLKKHCTIHKDNVYPELRPIPRLIIDDLIKYLEKISLVRVKTGSAEFLRVNDTYLLAGSELTKITPCTELKELVRLCEFDDTAPVIQIHKKVNGEKYPISYHPEHFEKMTATTANFNKLLSQHSRTIEGKTLPAPNLKRKFLHYNKEKAVLDDTDLLAGRFYGGIEFMKRTERTKLLHDDEITVEVDLSSCHIAIAYNKLLGITPVEPYFLYDGQDRSIRKIIKKVANTALNCTSEGEVVGAITNIINKGELEIPIEVYDNLTQAGKERGKYFYNGAPDPDVAKTECTYKLSAIVADTLQKHNELFQLVWSKENYGVYLQRIESNILAQMMDAAIQDHKVQNRRSTNVIDTPDKFDIQTVHKSYSQCLIFEPIHDGVRVKRSHATRVKNMFESICNKLEYDIKAEIQKT